MIPLLDMLRVRQSVIRNSQKIYAHARQFSLACHNIFIVGYLFSSSLKERKRPILERTLPDSVRCKSSRVTFPTRICGYSRPNTTDIRDNNGNSVSSLRGYSHVLFTAHVYVHAFRPNDQKSFSRPIVYAYIVN